MKKIPSLFKRDYEGTRQVYNEVVPGSEWVQNGEGTATEKLDGTACAVINGRLYKRFDRKKGKDAPTGWLACQTEPDENTGHWPGWVPISDAPEDKWHREAFEHPIRDGTYELVGPKVNGNPHGFAAHHLARHGDVRLCPDPPRDFDGLKQWFVDHPDVEGIVWHHKDGRMVKIKRKDFGLRWPEKNK